MSEKNKANTTIGGVEKYRLTFTHEIIMDNGDKIKGSLPITTEMMISERMPYSKQDILRRLYERMNDFDMAFNALEAEETWEGEQP